MLTEEFLLAAGKEYDRRIEERRRLKEAQELEEMRDRPMITPYAQSIVRSGAEPVEDRLMALWKRKQEAMSRKKFPISASSREEEENMKFKPEVTPLANQFARNNQGRITQEFIRKKEEHLKESTRRVCENEGASFAPRINTVSRDMIASNVDRTTMSVEDFLLMREEQRRHKLHNKTEDAWETAIKSPVITKRAKSLVRPGSISSRLYQDAEKRNAQLQLLQDLELEEQEFSFRPNTDKKSRETVGTRNVPVYDRLTAIHHENLTKLEERQAAEERKKSMECHNHNPIIDDHSKALAAARKDTSLSRLTTPRPAQTPSREVHSYKPELNSYSIELDERRIVMRGKNLPGPVASGSDRFGNRLARWNAERTAREKNIYQMRQEKEQQEMRECTFDVRQHSSGSFRRTSPARPVRACSESRADFVRRNDLWCQRKEIVLEQKRVIESTKELEDCTFIPYVNHDIPRVSSSAAAMYEGVAEHIQRQAYAREIEQQRKKTKATGRTWTGKPTKPVEFLFQKRQMAPCQTPVAQGQRGSEIKSLQRPVQGPGPVVVPESTYSRQPLEQHYNACDESAEDFLMNVHKRIVNSSGPQGGFPMYR